MCINLPVNLRRLHYFVTVAHTLHVARAADRLGIAQPALSQQLHVLEAELGVALLRRVGRGIGLTEAGAAFLPEAQAVLAQSARAASIAKRTARGELGRLSIGYVSTTLLEPALPAALAALRAAVPEAEIRLEEGSVQGQIEALTGHRIDLAVVRAPVGTLPAGLRARRFARSRLLAVVPAPLAPALPAPLPLAALAGECFVLMRDPPGIGLAGQVRALCAAAGFAPARELHVDSVTSIVGLVAAGFGVSLVPEALTRLRPEGAGFLPLDGPAAESELLILHDPGDAAALKQRFLRLAGAEG